MESDTESSGAESLRAAEECILRPNDLSLDSVGMALDALMGRGADFADLYFESWPVRSLAA